MQQPLVVAVTGHRDLVDSEVDEIRGRVRNCFAFLAKQYPDVSLQLLSALAEGADQLAAEVALEMGVELVVPLPMTVDDYVRDFDSEAGVTRFHELCEQASEVFVVGSHLDALGQAERYAHLGIFLASHCHLLMALWDGKDSGKLGGTSEVVKFHHDDIMPGYAAKSNISQQMLIDDESDLVYHVVCSRDRADGQPADGLEATDWWWFTKDPEAPRSKALPDSHDSVLSRANDFSHDAQRFENEIREEAWSLIATPVRALGLDGLSRIDGTFRCADYLAIHYQRKSLRTLRATHLLAFIMGALFILYSDLATAQPLLYLFLACFAAAAGIQAIAVRRAWFRKYLDYRTLAEGLRVQFYWALAGISQDDLDLDAHDNFLRLQDPEVGWIRNAMRAAGMYADAQPRQADGALDVAIDEWVGGQDTGQLGYYATKTAERTRRKQITETLGKISLAASAIVVVTLLIAGSQLPPALLEPMLALMGITLLLFAVRHGYAHAIAETELIKQYEFMLHIFANARKRLDESDSDKLRRHVLIALGRSALDEHAQWILMHRERSLDQTEIWRMGSG